MKSIYGLLLVLLFAFQGELIAAYFSDNFGATNLSTANWPSGQRNGTPRTVNFPGAGNYPSPSNPRVLELAGGTGSGGQEMVTSKTMNLRSVSVAYLRFHHSENDFESGESVIIEYKNSSSTWVNLRTLPGTNNGYNSYQKWTFVSIVLPSAAKHASAQFRLRTNAAENSDTWFFDDMTVTAFSVDNAKIEGASIIKAGGDVSFSFVYTSGAAPSSVKLLYEGKSYTPTAGGSNWSSGVKYTSKVKATKADQSATLTVIASNDTSVTTIEGPILLAADEWFVDKFTKTGSPDKRLWNVVRGTPTVIGIPSNLNPPSSPNILRINGGGAAARAIIESQPFDLSTVKKARLVYNYEIRGLDNGEKLVFEINGGTGWVGLDSVQATGFNLNQTQFTEREFSLASTFLKKGVKFRFRNTANGGNDFAYIDDVSVTSLDIALTNVTAKPGILQAGKNATVTATYYNSSSTKPKASIYLNNNKSYSMTVPNGPYTDGKQISGTFSSSVSGSIGYRLEVIAGSDTLRFPKDGSWAAYEVYPIGTALEDKFPTTTLRSNRWKVIQGNINIIAIVTSSKYTRSLLPFAQLRNLSLASFLSMALDRFINLLVKRVWLRLFWVARKESRPTQPDPTFISTTNLSLLSIPLIS